MSDYLSSLAERSLERVAAIRPRLASFYEPPQHRVAFPPEPVEPTAEAEFADAADVRPVRRREPDELPARVTPHVAADRLDAPDAPPIAPGVAPENASPRMASAASVAPSPDAQRPVDRAPQAAARPPAPLRPVIAAPAADDTPRERRPDPPRQIPTSVVELEVAGDPAPPTPSHVETVPAPRIAARREPPVESALPSRRTEQLSAAIAADPVRSKLPAEIPAPPRIAARTEPPAEEWGLPPRHIETPWSAEADDPIRSKPPEETPAPLRDPRTGPWRPIVADRAEAIPVAPEREHREAAPLEEKVSPPQSELLPGPPPSRIKPARIVVEPRLAPRVQPAPQAPRPHREDQPAPDIQVTIGRVEVRAVPAAEPPARGRPAPPASFMSLDDYLRRRGERAKR